jgi:PAS domain S-box-containing protein
VGEVAVNEPLRILLIDDNPDDRVLTRRALGKQFESAAATEVGDAAALEDAYARDRFDVVIIDHRLAWGDPLDILREAKERWPHCAVVAFTGAGSEETPASAIALSAGDGVLKTRGQALSLPTAVQAALRLTQDSLDRTRLTAILENTTDLVGTADIKGNVPYINAAGRRMLGLAEDQNLSGYRIADAHPAWAGDLVLQEGLPAAARDGVWRGETAFLGPDGREFPASQVIIAHRDGSGAVQYYSTVARDISELRRAELGQRALYRISEAASAAVDLAGLYPAIHAIIAELMPATNFYIATFDAESDTLSFPYFADELDTPPSPRKRSKGLTEYVLRTGETLHASPEAYAGLVSSGAVEPIGSPPSDWLGVPLKSGERVAGVLAVQSYAAGVRFREEDRRLLEFVSSQVAAAIERTSAAAALRASEAHLRALFAAMNDVVLTLDRDGRYLSIAPTNPNLLYRPANELIGRTQHDVLPQEKADWGVATIRRALDEHRAIEFEYNLEVAGEVVWFEGTVSPLAVDRVIWVARDVTERRQAEDRLRESELRIRTILESAPDGVVSIDERGVIQWFNQAAAAMFGYAPEEAVGRNVSLLMPEPYTSEHDSYIARYLATGERKIIGRIRKVEGLRRDGTVFPIDLSITEVWITGGRAFVGIVRDITDRERVEAALRDSEERYRLLFRQAPVGVFHYDTALRITECNDRFVEILGTTRDRLIGLDLGALRDQSVLPAVQAVLQGTMGSYEGFYRATASDAELWISMRTAPLFDSTGAVTGAVCIVEDMSEHQRLENQLRQAQKLEAIGQLAGGVAHDFNNLLQALLGSVQLLRLRADDVGEVARTSEELEAMVQRGAALTRQLLLFSRREITKPEPFDLGELVEAASKMLRRLLREDVRVQLELAPRALTIHADRGQIEQVFMNLVMNAADAMPDGGEIVVRTGAEDAGAWLEVKDNGTGMPESIKDHVFEPFFTTKEAGKGTGLGLSVVYGIVTRHGGTVEVESALGRGSSFRVSLPLGPGTEPPARTVASDRVPLAGGAGERILVVEDQDDARKAIAEILARLGYEVAQAASGSDAFNLPRTPAFDLLLSDIVLPDASGTDVAAGLQSRWPKMRVILMSGYTEDEVARRAVGIGLVRFLQKPFNMDTLAREIRAALDEEPAGTEQ